MQHIRTRRGQSITVDLGICERNEPFGPVSAGHPQCSKCSISKDLYSITLELIVVLFINEIDHGFRANEVRNCCFSIQLFLIKLLDGQLHN